MDAQTREDLERLATRVADDWEGGLMSHCLLSCMSDDLPLDPLERFTRQTAMIQALGFQLPTQMYHWNDKPGRTRDQVLARVKGALNR
jgi:hypothetical protein